MNLTLPPECVADGAPTRIHLTHVCPIVRAGLLAILSAQPDFMVSVDERCPSGYPHPCVVVTDYAAGMQAARQVWPQRPGYTPRVLILTSQSKEWEVRQAVDSGVHGYLLLGCSAEELVKSVRMLGHGVDYLSATATRSVIDSMKREALTRRETEVLHVLARGGSDKLIARELGIGVGTVKSHIKHLLEKLDATARTHAVVVAMRRGLLSEIHMGAGAAAGYPALAAEAMRQPAL